ncbi:Crp/Fnr family transcriptional regulator [Variovorax sp. WS11]|uniref:Crp/Fnr family transcriptional regulator n=1 Tax=Variovorax sp. WS11 TaxID=1105204 RepID=UPI000D0CB52A|nr:Crp/Fnr family transcriptional regulator [Variovorax sp. WS11]PSL82894.1 Crp/Fnr family transcriptional regulator [Variovorax sp. WS11]
MDAFLKASGWFAQLPEREQADVAAQIRWREVAEGTYLFRQGAPSEYWWGVADGLLKMCSTEPDGQQITFTGLSRGAWFSEGSVLRGEPIRYDVVALRDSRLAAVPAATFFRLYHHHIGFAHYLIAQLNDRLQQFVTSYAMQRSLPVDSRVARSIAGLFHRKLYPGTETFLKISQEEVATLAGVSRQRCSQALGRLRDAGLLRTEYQGITILDLEGLRRFEG